MRIGENLFWQKKKLEIMTVFKKNEKAIGKNEKKIYPK